MRSISYKYNTTQKTSQHAIKSDRAPAEHLIVLEVVEKQDALQLFPDVVVIWLGVELQIAHVLEQGDELLRDLVAEGLRGGH